MSLSLGFACLSFFAQAGSCAAAELPRYDIEAQLDTSRHTLEATQTVSFTNNFDRPLGELYFHIYPHRAYTRAEIRSLYRYGSYFKVNPFPEGFQSGDLTVHAVSEGDRPLRFDIEGSDASLLKVSFNEPIGAGQTRTVVLRFSLRIPHSYGRFGWHKDIITLTRWYPLLCVFDAEGWHNYPFYIYHQPFFSEASWYRLHITLPAQETVASGCALKQQVHNPDGTKTLQLESDAPMRDLGLGISRRFSSVERACQTHTIRAYYIDNDRAAAEQAAENAAGLMAFHAARFGAYPYTVFSIVPSYLGFGGDQSSGLVFIDTRMFRLPAFMRRYFDFLVSHETGHQWFYNIVGSDEYRQMFMDEAMNSYWLLRYLEEKYGFNAAVLALPRYLNWLIPSFSFRDAVAIRYLLLQRNGYDRPVIGALSGFREPTAIFALAYGKGAAILEMLEKKIGRPVFDRLVARYAQAYRFRNVALDDLIRMAQEESAQDLGRFFGDWLTTDTYCDVGVARLDPGRLSVENKGACAMPTTVRITYDDATVDTVAWDGAGRRIIPAPADKRIKSASVDPEGDIILDTDRTNNYWPRRLSVRPVPLYFFAYEIPVFFDRDSYNAVFGPQIAANSAGIGGSIRKPYDDVWRLQSLYDFSGHGLDSALGYERNHLFGRHNALGAEIFHDGSHDANEPATGGKVYFRQDLWPASPSLFGVNDHATAYLIRQQKLNRDVGRPNAEASNRLIYRKHQEAIVGLTAALGRSGPFEDPVDGWRFKQTMEGAGHFLGGTESFWRTSAEITRYSLAVPRLQHTVAWRVGMGWGGSADKELFEIGGAEGLRGYDKADIQGSRMALASAEYRVPLATDMRWYCFGNILRLSKLQAAAFLDAGRAWYADYARADWKKDAGLGLRLHFDLAGPLESLVVRLDVAQAINESDADPHVWLGVNQSF